MNKEYRDFEVKGTHVRDFCIRWVFFSVRLEKLIRNRVCGMFNSGLMKMGIVLNPCSRVTH